MEAVVINPKNQYSTVKEIKYGRFDTPSDELIGFIKNRIEKNKVTFMLASIYITPEAASIAYALRNIVKFSQDDDIKAMFNNADIEAVSAAIKLAKQYSLSNGFEDEKNVLILDREYYLKKHFNASNSEPDKAIVPGVFYFDSIEKLKYAIDENRPVAVVWKAKYSGCLEESSLIKSTLNICKNKKIVFILDESSLNLGVDNLYSSSIDVDITTLGENLTKNQMPFGVMLAKQRIFQAWDNLVDCAVQTSTFGSNNLACEWVLNCLIDKKLVSDSTKLIIKSIHSDYEIAKKYYGKYCNPYGVESYKMINLALDFTRAKGSLIYGRDGAEYIDLSGNHGCSLRGHNPEDIVSEVLECFDPNHNYWGDLAAELKSISGFDYVMPAVSGATSVDTAFQMAMLGTERTKIICIKNNYSGKTLPSSSLSQTSPITRASSKKAFTPYYKDIVFFDAFQENAEEKLGELLSGVEPALVWLEVVQGASCRPLPEEVLHFISKNKEKYGYLIGVDEVLTAYWRSTKTFFFHQMYMDNVDVTTCGKQISDMSFPISCAFIRREVYLSALSKQPESVSHFNSTYVNQIGSAIALNALKVVNTPEALADARALSDQVRERLVEITRLSDIYQGVQGLGNLNRLIIKGKTANTHSSLAIAIQQAMSSYLLEKAKVLVMVNRYNPAAFSNDAEVILEGIERVKKAAMGMKLRHLYFHMIKMAIKYFMKRR